MFISHDSRDAPLAEAFATLLQDASGGVLKSFWSSSRKHGAGIEYGQEWYSTIMQKLDGATDVVALLTARSLGRPWILYEAGVFKGKTLGDERVLGLALGVPLEKVSEGPFAQFQNSADTEQDVTALVLQLVRRHPESDPREETVRGHVRTFLQAAARLSGGSPANAPQGAPAADLSAARLFEEIKALVGGVPERIAGGLEQRARGPAPRRRRRPLKLVAQWVVRDLLPARPVEDVAPVVLLLFGCVAIRTWRAAVPGD